jgi:hypothetical protein
MPFLQVPKFRLDKDGEEGFKLPSPSGRGVGGEDQNYSLPSVGTDKLISLY